jgi:hypothetical protein
MRAFTRTRLRCGGNVGFGFPLYPPRFVCISSPHSYGLKNRNICWLYIIENCATLYKKITSYRDKILTHPLSLDFFKKEVLKFHSLWYYAYTGSEDRAMLGSNLSAVAGDWSMGAVCSHMHCPFHALVL